MPAANRMPSYDVRNDGIGPYAVFTCEICGREHRTQPETVSTPGKELGRQAVGGLLRRIPIAGAFADNVTGEDPRYVYSLTPEQVERAWKQVEPRFHLCNTCLRIVCPSCYDAQSDTCSEDSPRRDELEVENAEQAGHVIKGFASAFGLGGFIQQAAAAAQQTAATAQQGAAAMARCPKDGTLAPAGVKFCAQCGSPMTQPVAKVCPQCGQPAEGKFCAHCGAKLEQPPQPGVCPQCGKPAEGKFCAECGAKLG